MLHRLALLASALLALFSALPAAVSAQTSLPVLVIRVDTGRNPWLQSATEISELVFGPGFPAVSSAYKEMSANAFSLTNACSGVGVCKDGAITVTDDVTVDKEMRMRGIKLADKAGFPFDRFAGSDGKVSRGELLVLVISNWNPSNDNGQTMTVSCWQGAKVQLCMPVSGVGNGASFGLIGHEFGHGLKPAAIDVYGHGDEHYSSGVSLMSAGRPVMYMDPWHRAAYGWTTFTRTTSGSVTALGNYELNGVLAGGKPLLVRRTSTSNEALIFEWREKSSYDEDVATPGVVAWYVQASDIGANLPDPNNTRALLPALEPGGLKRPALLSLAPVRCYGDPMDPASAGRVEALKGGSYAFRWADGTSTSWSVTVGTTSTGKPRLQFSAGRPEDCQATRGARALASGDFNGDGVKDLAVGAPFENGTGEVYVFFGSGTGLNSATRTVLTPFAVSNAADRNGHHGFGAALASADFNNDGIADLAIGAPNETSESQAETGAVYLLRGSSSGLIGYARYTESSGSIPGVVEPGDHFGGSLTTGKFNTDSYADLVVGSPGEQIAGHPGAGAITLLWGSASGVSSAAGEGWNEDQGAADNENFGFSVAAGDFDGNGIDDLVVGVPGEAVSGLSNAGMIHVLFSKDAGGLGKWFQQFNAKSTGFASAAQVNAQFGYALASSGGSSPRLAIGVPGLTVQDTLTHEGAVHIMRSSSSGLSADGTVQGGAQITVDILQQAGSAAPFTLVGGERFGASLAFGQTVGTSTKDLLVGAPNASYVSKGSVGAVYQLDGSDFVGSARRFKPLFGTASPGELTGTTVAVGRFTRGATFDDAVVTAPGEEGASTLEPTTFIVSRGSSDGLVMPLMLK